MMLSRPGPKPAEEPTWEKSVPIEDYFLMQRLQHHLKSEEAYYRRVIDMNMHPDAWAVYLASLADHPTASRVDAAPLEFLGAYSAHAFYDQDPSLTSSIGPVPDEERLVTLPSRGVFAEAKLGNCNVAEEIDETRFWKWEEHPLVQSSGIKDLGLEPPQKSDLAEKIQPTPLPAPVVQIQQPLAAPDPMGLAAALKAISTPDIFRDMSASSEVQKLLSDLVSGAVDMSGAKKQAQDIQEKQANAKKTTTAQAQEQDPKLAHAAAEDQRAKQQQISPDEAHRILGIVDKVQNSGAMSKEEASDFKKATVSNIKGTTAPKPIKPVVKQRTFLVQLLRVGGRELDGNWGWELKQPATAKSKLEESLGFMYPEPRKGGQFAITFNHENWTDPVFHLRIEGVASSGISPQINNNILLNMAGDRFDKGLLQHIQVTAATDSYTKEESKWDEAIKGAEEKFGFEFGVDKAIIAKASGESVVEHPKTVSVYDPHSATLECTDFRLLAS
jgi:hypothetical protein